MPPTPELTLQAENVNVVRVYAAESLHVGNLKKIGSIWKFKAIGYDAAGQLMPGHGPFTHCHNLEFAEPDAMQISLALHLTQPPKAYP